MKKKKFSKNRIAETDTTKDKGFSFSKNIGFIVVMGIVLIMVISIFTFGLSGRNNDSNSKKIDYNGFKFVNRDGLWSVNINGHDYNFEYSPRDVEIVKSVNLRNESFSSKTYLAFNPEEFSENSLELTKLKQFITAGGVFVSLACIKEKGCGDIPIVDCNNINKVVYLKNGNKTEIYKDNNCLVLEAVNGQYPLIINRFMYGILGVM